MPGNDPLFIPNRRQVCPRIPAKNKRNIIAKSLSGPGIHRCLPGLSQQLIQSRAHPCATDASIRGGCHASAASANAAKIARDNALCA